LVEQENAGLREKIQALEEVNRAEVVNIEVKYKDIQKKDTTDLISGHVQEIRTLIAEIDKLNWLLRDKNSEIQNLIRDKKEQKIQEEERELALRAEIDTLKNKLDLQQEKAAFDTQEQNKRINSLADKLLRDSDAYSQRLTQLSNNINALESELKSKQNELDHARSENNIKSKESQRKLEETIEKLDKTRQELSDTTHEFASYRSNAEEQQANANS
jgi:DNA repair exonuclease SbcCD ATPase subunit